jgi:hypothetical protein
MDGIISYLTKKHGGNVHRRGIVTLTAKTPNIPPSDDLSPVVDIGNASSFVYLAKSRPWICWDFHESRVCLSHYALHCYSLQSWVVEGSLDGESWTIIDQKLNNQDFVTLRVVRFPVMNELECRFVRLTSTRPRHDGQAFLSLTAAEFFGTLTEQDNDGSRA